MSCRSGIDADNSRPRRRSCSKSPDSDRPQGEIQSDTGSTQSSHRTPERAPIGPSRRKRTAAEGTAPAQARFCLILADTSVWVDHLRAGNAALASLLDRGMIFTHPFVIGELSLGNLRDRALILDLLSDLPAVTTASDQEVLHFIEQNSLSGRGIGLVDAHLLASTQLTPGVSLWTRDKRLNAVATALGLAATTPKP